MERQITAIVYDIARDGSDVMSVFDALAANLSLKKKLLGCTPDGMPNVYFYTGTKIRAVLTLCLKVAPAVLRAALIRINPGKTATETSGAIMSRLREAYGAQLEVAGPVTDLS